MLLKDSQQLDLKLIAYAIDLIQKNRAAVSRFKTPGTIFIRAGERAFCVPKEFTFQQALG